MLSEYTNLGKKEYFPWLIIEYVKVKMFDMENYPLVSNKPNKLIL